MGQLTLANSPYNAGTELCSNGACCALREPDAHPGALNHIGTKGRRSA